MNPANRQSPYPTLFVLPKLAYKPPQQTRYLRKLEPQSGILWASVAPIFDRYGWDIQEQTRYFIKAYHAVSAQTVIVSYMTRGQVLVNHDYRNFSASQLHELEALADVGEVKHSLWSAIWQQFKR